AAGLTLVIVVQAAIIVAGNAKLIPLTGITLPWIAYGGSSMIAGGIVLGLLLAIAVEDRPGAPVERLGWRERVSDASRAAAGRVERVVR
ncbi:MAG: FtsW/RodA/SpoVE family cell cycle protein, partial [Candidatus Limnocylindrales bacterium]